jgi:predicted DNA-binding transcriptional regulator AlpA
VSQRRREYTPTCEPLGLRREDAAAYVGISASLFDQMVADARMPEPRLINSCTVWDREELRAAFRSLPKRGSENPWDKPDANQAA